MVAVLEDATDENLPERMEAYILKYYPLVTVNPDTLDDRARIEQNRQNEALNKEMHEAFSESFASLSPSMRSAIPDDLLNELRKEGLIDD